MRKQAPQRRAHREGADLFGEGVFVQNHRRGAEFAKRGELGGIEDALGGGLEAAEDGVEVVGGLDGRIAVEHPKPGLHGVVFVEGGPGGIAGPHRQDERPRGGSSGFGGGDDGLVGAVRGIRQQAGSNGHALSAADEDQRGDEDRAGFEKPAAGDELARVGE